MDNQHKKITGYRGLTQDEIDLMNRVKEIEADFAKLAIQMNERPDVNYEDLKLGVQHIKAGSMWLARSIAKPQSPFAPLDNQ